jgi:hypothetical protein
MKSGLLDMVHGLLAELPVTTSQLNSKCAEFYGIDASASAVDRAVMGLELYSERSALPNGSSPIERARRLRGENRLVQFLDDMLYPDVLKRRARHIRKAPVIGTMVDTFKKHHKQARQFWKGVRDGVDDQSDPRARLRKYLLSVHGEPVSKKKAHSMRVRSILAWNEWRGGRRCYYRQGMELPTVR